MFLSHNNYVDQTDSALLSKIIQNTMLILFQDSRNSLDSQMFKKLNMCFAALPHHKFLILLLALTHKPADASTHSLTHLYRQCALQTLTQVHRAFFKFYYEWYNHFIELNCIGYQLFIVQRNLFLCANDNNVADFEKKKYV